MKWIIIIALIAITAFIGYRLGYKFTVRARLYSDLVLFTDYYIAQMNYKGNTVKKIMNDFSGGIEIKTIFDQYIEQTDKHSESNIKFDALKENELDHLHNFLNSLGRSDAVAQTDTAKGYRDIFAERCAATREEKKKYGSLYFKLGMLLGVLLGILLI